MAFDPSVISQIGESGPDVTGSMARGFQLKDLINTEQLNQLRLNQVKTEQGEQLQMKEILKGEDLSTPQGITKAAQALTKAGLAQQGMKLMGTAQQYQTGAIEQEEKSLQVAAQKQDQVALALDNVYGQLQKLESAGATPEMLDLAAAQLAKPAIQRLRNSIPEMGQYLDKFVSDPKNLTFAGIKQAEDASNKVQALIKERLGERAQATKEAAETEKERHDRATEALGEKRAEATAGGFTPEVGELLGALTERGISLPAGFRSKQQQIAMLNGIMRRNPGLSADEIADKIGKGQIEFGAEKKETQAAAGIAGRVSVGENELIDFAPKALAISAKVNRGKWVPLNKLIQKGEASISDPDLKELTGRTNAILNAYDVVAARGGTDMKKREENRQNLLTADSPEAYKRAVETMIDEAKIAKGAARKAEGRETEKPSTPKIVNWNELP